MPGETGSTLLLQEYDNAGDARFLVELRKFHPPKAMAALAERMKKDPRPWVRSVVLEYLGGPLNCAGHQPLVKRLFKHAEHQRDDGVMGAFMVAFDRLVRRQRRKKHHFDWQARESWEEEVLRAPRNRLPADDEPLWRLQKTGRLFSYRTRYYLRRRAWRYFRRMGYQRPADYVPAVAAALRRYRDDDFAAGENILDHWGLLQACFRRSEALKFGTSTVQVREGRRLSELTAAPRFPKLWQAESATDSLLSLVVHAASRLVRVWAMDLLRRHHLASLRDGAVERLIELLDHDDGEVQQFGAELLAQVAGLGTLSIDTWLRLLQTRNVTALETIGTAMRQHVSPERLELAQCIALACSAPSPAARLGAEFLKARRIDTDVQRAALVRLANAECAAVAGELATWALSILGRAEVYHVERICPFFDSLRRETREAAWNWLTPESAGYGDAQLFCRLIESPHDDIRLRLIERLDRRAALPGVAADRLTPIWCSILLNVHRGGRHKLRALDQISGLLAREPASAETLMPVVAVAIRSVRMAEARRGLAALVRAVEAAPQIAVVVERHLPELKLTVTEAAA